MSKFFIKILLLLAFSLLLAACPKTNNSPQTGGILTFDQTDEAGNEVKEANEMLKLIKQRFKENEGRLDELQAAMKGRNPEKVREISDELVTQINAGTEVGEEAINKLRVAQEKNINEDYKEYLSLKIQALERYVQAFEERRQAAILLRDGYDPKNEAKRQQVTAAFTERGNKFKEIVQSARELSEEANRLARESLNRKS
jgi:hypothetical protein